ncbi:large conductance mechanosensitive channel protein MscL [Kitasatospora herbaricolor]|uniref:Large conductance mechanosensitive channel protein MscL n=1 Tax=Kitasatospora herbaricolor TaxID=68217 RepID=A0ABZ1WI24_9ACTN|nr:large conductance mechanosensitive channel protein MscL [Kitasatospora herbaricolor]
MKGFRGFVLRGNVVDLAVGVVIGAAFTGVVTALVHAFLTPLAVFVTGAGGDLGHRGLTLRHVRFEYGTFLDAVITFTLTAAVLYLLVVRPADRLHRRIAAHQDGHPPEHTCPECLSAIPAQATRCAFCTAELVRSADRP